eukprot:scaffold191329_cov18-Tisochrysis_lutea.AAC.1
MAEEEGEGMDGWADGSSSPSLPNSPSVVQPVEHAVNGGNDDAQQNSSKPDQALSSAPESTDFAADPDTCAEQMHGAVEAASAQSQRGEASPTDEIAGQMTSA